MKCEACINYRETAGSCYSKEGHLIKAEVNPNDNSCSKFKLDNWKVRILNTKWVLGGGQ